MFLRAFLYILIIGFTNNLFAAAPEWTNNYPSLQSGASSIDIKVALNIPGLVYYVIYDKKPNSINAQKIKDDVTSNNKFISKGIIEVKFSNTEEIVNISGILDNRIYYISLVGESTSGELMVLPVNKECVLAERHSQKSIISKIIDGAVIGYNAYFPEEYYKNPEKNFPLLIFLHGIDEKAKSLTEVINLKDVRKYGPPLLIDQGKELPFIVISPQTPYEWNLFGKQGTLVAEILEHVLYKYNADPSRVYVTGLSMGGNGTYGLFAAFPHKVAAALPFAGYCITDTVCSAKEVPFWAFHNLNDNVIGVGNDRTMVGVFNACNPPVPAKLTLFPVYGHDCWSGPYSNLTPGEDNIYEWALKNIKGNLPEDGTNKTPHIYAGPNLQVLSETKELTIESKGYDEDGFIKKYRWAQMLGPTVALQNEDSQTLTISNLQEAKYKFRLTVEDDLGRTTFDEVWVEVGDFILSNTKSDISDLAISLSPNPVNETINITAPVALDNPLLSIIDLDGKVLLETNQFISNQNKYSFDISKYNLSDGFYVLKLNSTNVSFAAKFIKE